MSRVILSIQMGAFVPRPHQRETFCFLLLEMLNLLGNLTRVRVGTSGHPRSTRLTTEKVSAEHGKEAGQGNVIMSMLGNVNNATQV